MGQYFQIFNHTKKEKLHPHIFGDGLKLMEFGSSGMGTMLGLAVLLRDSTGNGGGDFQFNPVEDSLVGSWAGCEISIVGDYDDSGIYDNPNYYDISYDVVELLKKRDPYFRQHFNDRYGTPDAVVETDAEYAKRVSTINMQGIEGE